MLGIFSLFIVLLASGANSSPFDDLIDEMIYEAQGMMIKKNLDKFELPHFEEDFDEHIIGPISVHGNVHASNGIFKNLTSIYRVAPVDEKDNPDGSMTFKAAFGLKEVDLSYNFGYKILFFSSEKSIEVKCTENALEFQLTMYYENHQNCNITVDHAELTSLGGFITTIAPKGVISGLESKLLTNSLNALAGMAKSFINENLTVYMNKALNLIDACKYVPF